MKLPHTERRKDFVALGLIALVLLVLLWPVTFGGKLLLPADMLMVMQPWKAHAQGLGFDRVHTPFLDPIQQHYPWRKFAADQMRRDIIPLWNPYMNCGTPFVANNQSACFYPETWLFALMPPEHAFGWAALLSLLMGGTFMFYFLRALGLRRTAALAGVLPFLLSGFMVGWMLLPTIRAVPMWLPLMLLAIERIIARTANGVLTPTPLPRSAALRSGEGNGMWWAAVLALATGMQFLAGHLHASVFVLLIAAAYAIFRVVQSGRREGTRKGLGTLGLCAAAVAVGTGLAMLQLLPVLELVRMTPRAAGMSFVAIRQASMVPLYFLTSLMPNLFGNPVDYNFWGYTLSPSAREWVETAWYVGLPTLLLMIGAVIWRRARPAQTWFWLGTWLGGIGLAWGTGLYYILYVIFPPLRQLPGVSRAVYVCCFAGSVLAALGFEALSRRLEADEHGPVRGLVDRAALIIGLLALIAGVGVWLYTGALEDAIPNLGAYTLMQVGWCLGLLALAVGAVAVLTWTVGDRVPPGRIVWGKMLLLAVLALDLGLFAHHFLPAVSPKYLHVQNVALDAMRRDPSVYRMTSLIGDEHGIDRMPPNLPMAFGFQDVQGSDSLVFRGYTDLWGIVPKDTKGNPMADSPILDLLNCKYILTSVDLSKVPGWRKVSDAEVGVWENTEVWPRAWVPEAFETVPLDEQLMKMSKGFDPKKVAYMDAAWWRDGRGKATRVPPPRVLETHGFLALRVEQQGPNVVSVSGFRANEPFVLSDMWYPGWHASGGYEVRVNSVLRGSVINRLAQVRFVYYPASFAVGVFVTCLCVMLLACGFVVGRRGGR
jgi:hypothetical protein